MNNKQTASPPMNVGISLLLVVFLILCLFTFAAIALTSAQSEIENANDMAGRTADYYQACNEAEATLHAFAKDVLDETEIFVAPRDFTFPINERQNLEITIEPNYEAGQSPYRIIRWQTVANSQWQTDETLQVLIPDLTAN